MSGRNAKLIRRVARELKTRKREVAASLRNMPGDAKASLRELHPPRSWLHFGGPLSDSSLRSPQTGYEHDALNVSVSQRGVSR